MSHAGIGEKGVQAGTACAEDLWLGRCARWHKQGTVFVGSEGQASKLERWGGGPRADLGGVFGGEDLGFWGSAGGFEAGRSVL